MNTKGVEDGISDDQKVKRSLSDICEELCPGVKARNANAFKRDPEVCLHGLKNCVSPLCVKGPTFSYQLAMSLTRNGADAPHMQAEINRFLYDGKWQTTQGAK